MPETRTKLSKNEGTYDELIPFGVQEVPDLSVQGVVYELIGIVSSDSDSETSFENYLIHSDKLQGMPRTKQTPRKNTRQGTMATFPQNPQNTNPGDNPSSGQEPMDTDDTEPGSQSESGATPAAPVVPVGKQPRKLIPKKPLRKAAPPSQRRTAWQKIAWWNRTARSSPRRANETTRGWMKRPEYKVRNARGRAVRRWRPGTLALREIKFYQHTQVFLIAIRPFVRLCRELGQDVKTDIRWRPEAFFALQQASEAFLTGYFSDVNIAAIHRKKVTIGLKDMKLVKKIRQHLPIYGTKDTECDEMHV